MLDPQDCHKYDDDLAIDADNYEWIMILRIVIICISATALLINIVIIINSTR